MDKKFGPSSFQANGQVTQRKSNQKCLDTSKRLRKKRTEKAMHNFNYRPLNTIVTFFFSFIFINWYNLLHYNFIYKILKKVISFQRITV